jgi:type I restriction enzyme M protein
VAAGEYLREHHPEILRDAKLKEHFHHRLFHGFDFDNIMLRIGSMNMLLHGVENPDIRYRDSLAQDHAGEEEKYTLILANPPFAGSLDYENTAKDLLQIVKTKKTELLFLALFLRLLKPGGRAAVIVPDGVLFGSSNAHKTLRQLLVEEQKLDAVISLPGGVFKPYAGVSTAILLFTKTNSGGTDHVWFYDVDADGMSLDDKRTELLPNTRRTTCPTSSPAGEVWGSESRLQPVSRSNRNPHPNLPNPATKRTTRRLKAGLLTLNSPARAPRRASASPRPTSPPRATTSRSTATSKLSTKKSRTVRQRKS